MILSNVQVQLPHSKSLVSLSQALANPNPDAEVITNLSMENIRYLRAKKEQVQKNQPPKSQRRRMLRKGSSSRTDGRDDSEKPTRSARSKEGDESKGSSIRRSTHSRRSSSFIKKTDVRTIMSRGAKIPKWIEVEIKVLDRPKSPSPDEGPPPKPVDQNINKNMMPLVDMAMILSNNLDGAIARGLFEARAATKKEPKPSKIAVSAPRIVEPCLQRLVVLNEGKDGTHRSDTTQVVEFRPSIKGTQAA